jgi:hypothetical protein
LTVGRYVWPTTGRRLRTHHAPSRQPRAARAADPGSGVPLAALQPFMSVSAASVFAVSTNTQQLIVPASTLISPILADSVNYYQAIHCQAEAAPASGLRSAGVVLRGKREGRTSCGGQAGVGGPAGLNRVSKTSAERSVGAAGKSPNATLFFPRLLLLKLWGGPPVRAGPPGPVHRQRSQRRPSPESRRGRRLRTGGPPHNKCRLRGRGQLSDIGQECPRHVIANAFVASSNR